MNNQYYTNISYEEAIKCNTNFRIFAWTSADKDYQEGQPQVTFNIDKAQKVDETTVYVGILDLHYIEHMN